MVEDAAMRNPHRAGLLFDGSSASAIAEPIDEVFKLSRSDDGRR